MEDAIYGWIRQNEKLAKAETNFVWWLHVVKNDDAAFRIVNQSNILKTDKALYTLMAELNQEPKVLELEGRLHTYEERYPEGMAATIWMRNELANQALQTEPWITQLRTLTVNTYEGARLA